MHVSAVRYMLHIQQFLNFCCCHSVWGSQRWRLTGLWEMYKIEIIKNTNIDSSNYIWKLIWGDRASRKGASGQRQLREGVMENQNSKLCSFYLAQHLPNTDSYRQKLCVVTLAVEFLCIVVISLSILITVYLLSHFPLLFEMEQFFPPCRPDLPILM